MEDRKYTREQVNDLLKEGRDGNVAPPLSVTPVPRFFNPNNPNLRNLRLKSLAHIQELQQKIERDHICFEAQSKEQHLLEEERMADSR